MQIKFFKIRFTFFDFSARLSIEGSQETDAHGRGKSIKRR